MGGLGGGFLAVGDRSTKPLSGEPQGFLVNNALVEVFRQNFPDEFFRGFQVVFGLCHRAAS